MDLSILPTDSLYKFIALSGLVLTIFTGYNYFKRKQEILEQMGRLELRLARYVATREWLEKEQNFISSNLSKLETWMSEAKAAGDEERLKRLRSLANEDAKRLAVLGMRMHKSSVSLAVQQVEIELLKRRATDMLTLLVASTIFGLIGAVLFCTGIWFWYVRLQRFQDLEVSKSPPAESAKSAGPARSIVSPITLPRK